MNINKCFLKSAFLKCVKDVNLIQKSYIYNRSKIGNRDWVGWGRNGRATYADDLLVPFPAIRFRENSNELLALREKEKGDWRKLSIEEKKCLYRASFRQTLAELVAPTGEWKSVLGWTLFFTAIGCWTYIAFKLFACPPLPKTFREENRRAQVRKWIDTKTGVISGLASKWDYDKEKWKK